MTYSAYPIPQLSLHISQSPLLCGGPSEAFCASLTASGICNPLPSLTFASHATRRLIKKPPAPANTVPKPLPPVPPREIISLVNLLESMDNDVTKEVQRVRESIKEARLSIREHQAVQAKRQTTLLQQRAEELRATKGVDDEFWLNA